VEQANKIMTASSTSQSPIFFDAHLHGGKSQKLNVRAVLKNALPGLPPLPHKCGSLGWQNQAIS
jgi:hypothetical protein